MKQYKINVNGTFYEVSIEEVDASEIKSSANTSSESAPAAKAILSPVSPAGLCPEQASQSLSFFDFSF